MQYVLASVVGDRTLGAVTGLRVAGSDRQARIGADRELRTPDRPDPLQEVPGFQTRERAIRSDRDTEIARTTP
jgi:hypothetical protein